MRLVSELRRRNVIRMAVLYMVAAWLIMQVAEVVIALASLPTWTGALVLAVLAIGFPVALLLSWFYEITPAGIALEKDVAPGDSITHVTGRRMDFIVISLLAAAVLLFAWHTWWPTVPTDKSIAVLAFENMSNDPEQEYFSDGISEELLNLLSQIPELRVISRTSAFSFKGKSVKIADIARELNVAHILEGSVRKAGDQVRITAQLVEARTDTHLWSETYERTQDSIFSIQDEIAAAVAKRLKVTLLDEVPESQETDAAAYRFYLQANDVLRRGTAESAEKAIELYHQALEIDPDYSGAWSALASAYSRQANSGFRPRDEGFQLAREAASHALAIDPAYARAHADLGWIALNYDDLAGAAAHLERALELDLPAGLSTAASLIRTLGRIEETIALEEYLSARDPVSPVAHYNLGFSYMHAGRWDDSIAAFRTVLTLSPRFVGARYFLGLGLLLKGEPEAALAAFEKEEDEEYRVKGAALALFALGRQEEFEEALTELIEGWGSRWPQDVAHVYAWTGDADAAFSWLEIAVAQNKYEGDAISPFYAPLHADPRWPAFRERTGQSEVQLAAIVFEVTLPD